MSLIRGVLLAGKFQTQHQLNSLSSEDQRNTLIFELSRRTNQPGTHFQGMNDDILAETGAVLVFLREAKIRTDEELKNMSNDDQRNTLIVEIGSQTGLGSSLQGFSNIDLVLLGLGNNFPGSLSAASFIRGVLLTGKFRTQHELNGMSGEDQRNTLIVVLTSLTNQSNYQSFNDFDLAGMGAVLVFLREAGLRNDSELKSMSADDQRNTLIVEIGSQTGLGSQLQGLRNMDLVRLGLGVDEKLIFKSLPPPLQQLPPLPYIFSIDSVEILNQKADSDHSDSDWLSINVTIANPLTKSIQTLPPKIHHIEGAIKTGDIIAGPFASDPINANDSDVVVVNYTLMNLGSSDAEDQFAQAVKVTDKIVEVAGPIVGGLIGLYFGNPKEGVQIGEQIAKEFDTAISILSDVFDFLDIHIGPPNCNGEVLHDTLTFLPNELAQAVNQTASREYTGPQENDRCGSAPVSKVNFSIQRLTEIQNSLLQAKKNFQVRESVQEPIV